jgi:HEAT repeat protein
VESYGDAAVPELLELIKGDDKRARESALLLLGQADAKSILPELRELVHRSLAPTKAEPSANPLSKTEVAALLGILARQEDAESAPLFRLGLESTSEPVRVAAIVGARRLLAPELIPALVARLEKERRPLAKQIEGVLCATCDKSPEDFGNALTDLPPKSRYEVARALSTNPSKNCRAMLGKLGSDPDQRVAGAAIRLLERPAQAHASGAKAKRPERQSEARQIADSLLMELKREVKQ